MGSKGNFEDDVLAIVSELRLGQYDHEVITRLRADFDRYGQWNDYNLEKAEKLMYKYRKQISALFWDFVKMKKASLTEWPPHYDKIVAGINRMVEHEIIPLLPQDHEEVKDKKGFVEPGVYELPTGEIYIVKLNREKSRVYAKRLVEAPSERMTVPGKVVDFDFEYEPGGIHKIHPEHLMDLDRAKNLMIRYGRCIVCGRRLKVAESVERGVGPVCIKYFGGGR